MSTCRILDEEGHPAVGALLCELRDLERQSDRARFRGALRLLGTILAYEIGRELPSEPRSVRTPLGTREEPVLTSEPVLATILRAALPLWEGMLTVFPGADSVIIGAARREGQLDEAELAMEVDLDYAALVPLAGRTLVYADPMIATGSTLRSVHRLVCERAGTPDRVFVAGVVAYRGALDRIEKELGARIIVASADESLDERGYIVPGLGDAGDLALGEKLR